jgi:hypothetical protein
LNGKINPKAKETKYELIERVYKKVNNALFPPSCIASATYRKL